MSYVTYESSAEPPVQGVLSCTVPTSKPTPPGTPVVITLVDGSKISVRLNSKGSSRAGAGAHSWTDGVSIDWADKDGERAVPPLVRSIMHGTNGIRWNPPE